jgi:hypothetical protein
VNITATVCINVLTPDATRAAEESKDAERAVPGVKMDTLRTQEVTGAGGVLGVGAGGGRSFPSD